MEEQEFHYKLNRNICLHCDGKGIKYYSKDHYLYYMGIGSTCPNCFGSGKRFQHLLKDGILEL